VPTSPHSSSCSRRRASALAIGAFVVLIVAPLVTTAYLARKLSRRSAASA
jgi:hypothetical protein